MDEPVESIGQTKAPINPQFSSHVRLLSDTPSIQLTNISISYRNWRISTKAIHGQMWLQWQHPKEKFPRYGIQVFDNRLSDTIRYARFLIDSIINLEQETETHSPDPQPSSLEGHAELGEDAEEFLLMESRWGY